MADLVLEKDFHSQAPSGSASSASAASVVAPTVDEGGGGEPAGAKPTGYRNPLGGDEEVSIFEKTGGARSSELESENDDEESPDPNLDVTPEGKGDSLLFKFGGIEITSEDAQARLAEYEASKPKLDDYNTVTQYMIQAEKHGYKLKDVVEEGMSYLAANYAFETDPKEAIAIIDRMVKAARTVHGDKFTLPDTVTMTINPEALDDAGKLLWEENAAQGKVIDELRGVMKQLAAQNQDLVKRFEGNSAIEKDLTALHAAHPETVGVVTAEALVKMKADAETSNPVTAYRHFSYKPDGAGASVSNGAGAGQPAASPKGLIPDAPRPGSAGGDEFDPEGKTADEIVFAARQGRPIKGGIPEKFRLKK